ncbi:MAG: UDP-3-O-(3-hydroxymyristoyl)glucosamine N-acyltransferase [Chromatiales bacterium]|nr:UDP-3-O-(3-hydroxymyristoyl)glucosamine N-acyltransferase [Chromatiales bacterium]
MAFRLAELAAVIGASVHGDPDCEISRVDTIQDATPGSICFLANQKYRRYLSETRASAVILTAEYLDDCRTNALVSDNPYLAYARISTRMFPRGVKQGGIHPSAVVSEQAQVSPDAWVGPGVVIEEGVTIAAGVQIGPGCVICKNSTVGERSELVANITLCPDTVLGKRVLIHPGAVVGSDGFGLANDRGQWEKVPQLGRVIIGDDVEIGANTTVDRGALRDTVIANGVKLDNQIQIAHNVQVGEHTAIAGCAGIAGSTTIGKYCSIGGGVGIAGHLEIGDNVHFSGQSLVTRSFKEPGYYSGNLPAMTNSEWKRAVVRLRRMEDLMTRLKALEQAVSTVQQDSETD